MLLKNFQEEQKLVRFNNHEKDIIRTQIYHILYPVK